MVSTSESGGSLKPASFGENDFPGRLRLNDEIGNRLANTSCHLRGSLLLGDDRRLPTMRKMGSQYVYGLLLVCKHFAW